MSRVQKDRLLGLPLSAKKFARLLSSDRLTDNDHDFLQKIYEEKSTLSFYYGFVFPGTSSMAINFVALRGNSFGLQACFSALVYDETNKQSILETHRPVFQEILNKLSYMDNKIKLTISAFGKFGDVEINPSSILVNKLDDEIKKQYNIANSAVLEVSTQGCEDWLAQLPEDSINIHLGVHGGASKFLLEQCGYNCKTFSIPDMRGNVFKNECVDEECQLDMSLETCINTTAILQHLKQQHTIAISQDPGRYICNYMYYCSLKKHRKCLFIHIPPFTKINEEQQFKFLLAFIEKIHELNKMVLPNLSSQRTHRVKTIVRKKPRSFSLTNIRLLKYKPPPLPLTRTVGGKRNSVLEIQASSLLSKRMNFLKRASTLIITEQHFPGTPPSVNSPAKSPQVEQDNSQKIRRKSCECCECGRISTFQKHCLIYPTSIPDRRFEILKKFKTSLHKQSSILQIPKNLKTHDEIDEVLEELTPMIKSAQKSPYIQNSQKSIFFSKFNNDESPGQTIRNQKRQVTSLDIYYKSQKKTLNLLKQQLKKKSEIFSSPSLLPSPHTQRTEISFKPKLHTLFKVKKVYLLEQPGVKKRQITLPEFTI